jgi:bifunctional non-homologous end joining protein LigD
MPTKKQRAARAHAFDSRQAPTFVAPMAALAVDALPEGSQRLYELKLDGYRALVIKDGASIKIRSRNDKDLMHMAPSVAAAARACR